MDFGSDWSNIWCGVETAPDIVVYETDKDRWISDLQDAPFFSEKLTIHPVDT